jgi:hypothetical protein
MLAYIRVNLCASQLVDYLLYERAMDKFNLPKAPR